MAQSHEFIAQQVAQWQPLAKRVNKAILPNDASVSSAVMPMMGKHM
jgi:hypothetical protein